MDIDELKRTLNAEQFDPRYYSLSGGDTNDTLCLSQEDGGWVTYYTERGCIFDRTFHRHLSDACEHFLHRMRSVPMPRINHIRHQPGQDT